MSQLINFPKTMKISDELTHFWTLYTSENKEKYFRKFVLGFVSNWEQQVCPNWELLMTSCVEGEKTAAPLINNLPDELLPALEKFLFICKDEAEQGETGDHNVEKAKNIIKCLIIICQNIDNIPLVASCNFVEYVTVMVNSLLQHVLQIGSSFFKIDKNSKIQHNEMILSFIFEACHFLEAIYDPFFQWRIFLSGKNASEDVSYEQTPIALHPTVIPFLYECFETALVESFPKIAYELLMVLGSLMAGAEHNALRAVGPAINKMLLKTVKDSVECHEIHIAAIYCSALSIRVLHNARLELRQIEIAAVIQQYQDILVSLALKDTVRLATLIEGVAMITRILKVNDPKEIHEGFVKNNVTHMLVKILCECKFDIEQKKVLAPVIINRINLILSGSELSKEQMLNNRNYKKLFECVYSFGEPDYNILYSFISMIMEDQELSVKDSSLIKNIHPLFKLIEWLPNICNQLQQEWLAESIFNLCCTNLQNKMICCNNGIIFSTLNVIKNSKKLYHITNLELLKLIECLGMHSISAHEIKEIILLLKDSNEFAYKTYVIHLISSMAKGDGFNVCRYYFDIQHETDAITVPSISQWSGPIGGYTFHCWIRLDKVGGERVEESGLTRRQLYSIYTVGGSGLEAFFSNDGLLVVSVSFKKDFLSSVVEDVNFLDGKWHCVDICHSGSKRPFGASQLNIYVDGFQRMSCNLKFPVFNECFSYCNIGAGIQLRSSLSLNLDSLLKSGIKDGILGSLRSNVPAYFSLPSSLKHSQNDSNVKWTLVGMQQHMWGESKPLQGQLGPLCFFSEQLSANQVKSMFKDGPNILSIFNNDENLDFADIINKTLFCYSARICKNYVCTNLAPVAGYDGHVVATPCVTSDVKDVINSIGGVQVLFPLLELAETCSDAGIEVQQESNEVLNATAVSESEDWVVLPSNSFSDWKLEQNLVSGFLTLIKNLIYNHSINQEQFMRGGGLAIVGNLMQKIPSKKIDVNVLMATQLLVELAIHNNNMSLLHQIYYNILFDFRIWSKSEFHVQIGHIQYLNTIIKDDRKYFRKKFGIQYILDVVRSHYCQEEHFMNDDYKAIRVSMIGIIKYFLQKEVNAKEVKVIVNFLYTAKQEVTEEVLDMLINYLESRQAKDQIFLILFEAKCGELLFCRLFQKELESRTKAKILKFISVLLRTNKISSKYKSRMYFQDIGYLGFLYQFQKEEIDLSMEEVMILFDQMMMSESFSSYQGMLGLMHHLQLAEIDIKLEVARKMLIALYSKPSAPVLFSQQVGWQDCITRLLVKTQIKPDLIRPVSIEDVITLDNDDESDSDSLSVATPSSPVKKITDKVMGAAMTAKSFLPEHANAVVNKFEWKVVAAADVATEKVSNTVSSVNSKVQKAQKIVGSVQSTIRTTKNQVQTGLEDFSDYAASAIRRKSNTSLSTGDCEDGKRPKTPQFEDKANYLYDFNSLSLDNKSESECSEDNSSSTVDADTISSSSHHVSFTPDSIIEENEDQNLLDMDEIDMEIRNLKHLEAQKSGDKEEELCQLVTNILFTIMFRGCKGTGDIVWKERGQVMACISMLGLNNELYKSAVELKRNIIENGLQAILCDLKENNLSHTTVNASYSETSERVMRWVYDMIVLDPHNDQKKKITDSLLDGVLMLLEGLVVFQEGQDDFEWSVMAKMAFNILIKCSENFEDIEVCAMSTAKLHTLIQTRSSSSIEENAFLIFSLNKIIQQTIVSNNEEHYQFLIPVMRALLDKLKDHINFSLQLPALGLARHTGPSFFDHFKEYCTQDEWTYFIEKKMKPLYDSFTSGFLLKLPETMNTFWAICFEEAKISMHKRNCFIGDSKIKFINEMMDPYRKSCKEELTRFSNHMSQLKSHKTHICKRWHGSSSLFFSSRGAWTNSSRLDTHFKLANNENMLRMRMKLIPNPKFDDHSAASAQRDNIKLKNESEEDFFNLQIAKEAVREGDIEDSLTEDELKTIAIENMESSENYEEKEKKYEKRYLSEECELVLLMSVVKGRFELTNTFLYFFDCSPVKDDVDRNDFRCNLAFLKEVHLRRFNLRRSAIEFFFVDESNFFLNFCNTKKRNKIYTRILALRLPNLYYHNCRSPAELLKASGLMQKWVNREISNFEYLMHLNTIAGRTYNDLSQYPVFPWILSDYTSSKLDLDNPKIFRDLSKPMGIQNSKHIEEVQGKFENFEDPSATVPKFHYGTHYSNSAGVLHYLVRVEPFTSLHVELQSNRFDVADRQFHSIPQSWRSLMENVNDVKELIPEFFYLPEFLLNLNEFDLGCLQGSGNTVNDVILPKWANSPDHFIWLHRKALESEHVSMNLHHWIDLIFGYKQKGKEAVKALNVFYYCSYEGAVDLDAISDPAEREAIEGMINNFGQTPCQLLKEAHPTRLSFNDYEQYIFKSDTKRPDVFQFHNLLKAYSLDVAADNNPIVRSIVPKLKSRSLIQYNLSDQLLTVSENGDVGVHSWLPYDKSGNTCFFFEKDSSLDSSKLSKNVNAIFDPTVEVNQAIFAFSEDGKYIFSGGNWDYSLRVYSVLKNKCIASEIRHFGVITCVAIDCGYVMTGSRDSTSIIWEPWTRSKSDLSSHSVVKASHVLCGHDGPVSSVSLSRSFDLALSASEDGTLNLYTLSNGQYLRTITCPHSNSQFEMDHCFLADLGHVVFAGRCVEAASIHIFTLNGRHLASRNLDHRVNCLSVSGEFLITGDKMGNLKIWQMIDLKNLLTIPLHCGILSLNIAPQKTQIIASLKDSRLVIVGVQT